MSTTTKKTATTAVPKQSNQTNVSVGDTLSYTDYYKVKKVLGKSKILVTDEAGQEVELSGEDLIKTLASANHFTSTVKVSRTEVCDIFKNNARVAMQVNYNLKVDKAEAVKALQAAYPNKGAIVSKADFDKTIKDTVNAVLEGKERTIIGRHYNSVDEFGRYSFIDMNEVNDKTKDYDTRTRKVDPRTINWVICGGTKFVVK